MLTPGAPAGCRGVWMERGSNNLITQFNISARQVCVPGTPLTWQLPNSCRMSILSDVAAWDGPIRPYRSLPHVLRLGALFSVPLVPLLPCRCTTSVCTTRSSSPCLSTALAGCVSMRLPQAPGADACLLVQPAHAQRTSLVFAVQQRPDSGAASTTPASCHACTPIRPPPPPCPAAGPEH
jgi:hypothetical protein